MTELQQKEIFSICSQYHTIVKYMVVELESDDCEYPAEILNEIRALLNHVAKCFIINEEQPDDYKVLIDAQIHDAKSHLKRAIYDCYKYSCISVEDYYLDFCHRMRHVDLDVIDNGEFSINLSKKIILARKMAIQAKKTEQDSMNSTTFDEVFGMYKNAYELYDDVRKYISESLVNIERACHKQAKSWWVAIGFGVFGLIGTIFTIVGFFLHP